MNFYEDDDLLSLVPELGLGYSMDHKQLSVVFIIVHFHQTGTQPVPDNFFQTSTLRLDVCPMLNPSKSFC